MSYKGSKGFSYLVIMLFCIVNLSSCGFLLSVDLDKYQDGHKGEIAAGEGRTNITTGNDIVPFDCKEPLSDLAFANKVTLTLFNRTVSSSEKDLAAQGYLDRSNFVQNAIDSPESKNGINRFIQALFRVENIRSIEVNDNNIAEALEDRELVSDLRKEPVELVLRNLDKPWPWFFTTDEIPCTKKTAKIYEFPELESSSFIDGCKLPSDRRGFLGLASVLRANPSSVFSTNNNYKRVAFAVYLMQGYRLFAATNGPEGEGLGIPLASCVPITDFRVDPAGLVFGTASVPAVGSTCASCHSRYNGPLSVAFRRFDEMGERYDYGDVDRLNGNGVLNAVNTSVALAKLLLNESKSCWSVDGISPPQIFSGITGLSRLIGENQEMLGDALGTQIPQNLGNEEPNPNTSSTIKRSYLSGSQKLSDAFYGYLISESFQCDTAGK